MVRLLCLLALVGLAGCGASGTLGNQCMPDGTCRGQLVCVRQPTLWGLWRSHTCELPE